MTLQELLDERQIAYELVEGNPVPVLVAAIIDEEENVIIPEHYTFDLEELQAEVDQINAEIAEAARLAALQAEIDELGDLALIIAEYLSGHSFSEDDSWNIAGFEAKNIESGFGWNISGLSKPTLVELQALKDQAGVKNNQKIINEQSQAYLRSTDWLIIREIDNGEPCPQEIKILRQAARDSII